jgi:hypothetical protein
MMGKTTCKSFLVAFLIGVLFGGFALAGTTHFCTVQASTDVSGIPKPSIPELTLKFVDNSYDVPPRIQKTNTLGRP